MATLASLTLDCLDMLYGQTPVTRPDFDTLTNAVDDANDTSWEFDQAGNQFWERGDYAEYFDGTGTAGEVVQLTADHDTDAADVTVLRAQRRTSASGGFSAADVFLKNPPFTHTEIQRAINETIDSDLGELWYHTNGSWTYNTDRGRYPLPAGYRDMVRVYQLDTDVTSVGTCTFDVTGGASEDLWTSASAHGLSVGDPVRFTAVGSGAEPYAVGTVYWVATVPSTTTFQLSSTESTTVLEGTGSDSSGTWTLELIDSFSYRELGRAYWEEIHTLTTEKSGTGGEVIIRSWPDTDEPLYYTARVYPASDDIASLPTEIADMVPWGTLARLLGGTAYRGRYESAADQTTIQYADSEFFKRRFEEMVDTYKSKLLREVPPQRHWIWGPVSG